MFGDQGGGGGNSKADIEGEATERGKSQMGLVSRKPNEESDAERKF